MYLKNGNYILIECPKCASQKWVTISDFIFAYKDKEYKCYWCSKIERTKNPIKKLYIYLKHKYIQWKDGNIEDLYWRILLLEQYNKTVDSEMVTEEEIELIFNKQPK